LNTCAPLLARRETSAVAEHEQSITRDIDAEFGDEAWTR
jgi:hypothetical protein